MLPQTREKRKTLKQNSGFFLSPDYQSDDWKKNR